MEMKAFCFKNENNFHNLIENVKHILYVIKLLAKKKV